MSKWPLRVESRSAAALKFVAVRSMDIDDALFCVNTSTTSRASCVHAASKKYLCSTCVCVGDRMVLVKICLLVQTPRANVLRPTDSVGKLLPPTVTFSESDVSTGESAASVPVCATSCVESVLVC